MGEILVRYVKHQLVLGSVKHIVERYHRLYIAEIRPDVAPYLRRAVKHGLPHLPGDFPQLVNSESLYVSRRLYIFQFHIQFLV